MRNAMSFNVRTCLILLLISLQGCGVPSSRGSNEADKGLEESTHEQVKASSEVALYNIPQFNSASFIGDDRAWLVTYRGEDLLITEDGGLSWTKIPAAIVGGFETVSFIDAQRGAVLQELLLRL